MKTAIPTTNLYEAYAIALKQIVESDATDEQKLYAKATLDALMSFNQANA